MSRTIAYAKIPATNPIAAEPKLLMTTFITPNQLMTLGPGPTSSDPTMALTKASDIIVGTRIA